MESPARKWETTIKQNESLVAAFVVVFFDKFELNYTAPLLLSPYFSSRANNMHHKALRGSCVVHACTRENRSNARRGYLFTSASRVTVH